MIAIKRGTPPEELIRESHEMLPDQRRYDNLSTETKRVVKESLLKSQGYLCAYCMRRVADVDGAKLEHIYPQSRSLEEGHPEQTLEYGNMLAVCRGGEGDSGQPYDSLTCDSHKRDTTIALDPSSQRDIDTIRYLWDGTICSTDAGFECDLNETLNLNCRTSFLPQNRAAVYQKLQEEIDRERPVTHEAKRAYARKKLESLEAADVKAPFVGVMVYRLKRWAR
ncbi:MAG TPA: hypothetical protein IAA15_08125 [Candidatus Olsenella pullicola]|nr:hypothetical protein [Candidatus Olsenella pullicola]